MREPEDSFNFVIQFSIRIMIQGLPLEADADKGFLVVRVTPPVDTDDGFRLEVPSGFFQRFAYDGIYQAFIILEMSSGLVEYRLSRNSLLYQQKTAGILYYCRDGE